MKPLLQLALVLLSISQLPAQAPRMTVRQDDGSSKRLRVEQADVTVRFLGDIAETVLDLRFRNDGERAVEGEFALPLPEGATVSAYALEVNGKLRAGVAVEKQRARSAYESVKRRMIDPGIVEREAGNIYRTQVYPVPAKGTKRLRISYTETLRPAAQALAYALPLDFPDALDSFSCSLRGASTGAIRVTAALGLGFAADGSGALKAEGKEVKLAGTLQVEVTPPAEPQMVLENDALPAFFLSDRVPQLAPRPRPAPANVMLVWDASASGLERGHAAEIQLLDSWFVHLGATRVSLRLLRERVEDGGEFEVSGGRWPKLKQALKQVDYDGGTALSRLQVKAGEADLVVLVSDGIATLGAALPEVAVPLVFVHCGTTSPPQALGRLARASGGVVIDLTTETPAAALAKLTQQPLRLLAVKGDDIATALWDQDLQPGGTLRVLGTLLISRAGKLELRYGFGNDLATSREVTYQTGGQHNGIVRRLHAQRVLSDLEHQDHPDPKQIIDHCKRNGLVSDHTSLIVLERIEDYVAHEIPPPEPELKADYDSRVAEQTKQRAADRGGLARAWAIRVHEFERRLPGYEALLLPRLRQVRIWKTALESQFAPAQRDAEAFATVAGWMDKAAGLIASKPKLRTADEYKAWRKAVDQLDGQGYQLAQTPPHLPPAGQPLTVSVRGFVVRPGLVNGDPGMTLRQAIDKAGGLDPLGGLDNVALYRNAGKIVYNTLSARYQDVQVFPGDMLVVGQSEPVYSSAVDPFAAAPEPSDPAKEDPIRGEGNLWLPPQTSRDDFEPVVHAEENDPFAGKAASRRARAPEVGWSGGAGFATPATPSGRRRMQGYSPPQLPSQSGQPAEEPPAASSEIPTRPRKAAAAAKPAPVVPAGRAPAAAPDLTDFAGALAAGRDPSAAYRKLSGRRACQPSFHVEAARILFAKQHAGLGRRVLSNLTELRPGDVAALRSYAYWLAEFGQAAEADAVLGTVGGDDPAALQVVLDRASILAAAGDRAAAVAAMLPVIARLPAHESPYLAAVALSEFNALRRGLAMPGPHPLAAAKENYRRPLDADIRFVVSSTGDVRVECSSDGAPGFAGGQTTIVGGMQEDVIYRAEPGLYRVSCAADKPTTVRAVIHKNWGRPEHTCKVVTLWLEAGKSQRIGEVDFEFRPRQPE